MAAWDAGDWSSIDWIAVAIDDMEKALDAMDVNVSSRKHATVSFLLEQLQFLQNNYRRYSLSLYKYAFGIYFHSSRTYRHLLENKVAICSLILLLGLYLFFHLFLDTAVAI